MLVIIFVKVMPVMFKMVLYGDDERKKSGRNLRFILNLNINFNLNLNFIIKILINGDDDRKKMWEESEISRQVVEASH